MASPRAGIVSPSAGALLAVAATCAALALGACGSDDQGSTAPEREGPPVDVSGAQPLGEETAGSVAQLVQCRDWNRGNEAEKLATIDDIRSQVHVEGSGIDAPPLSDEEAMELFEGACSPPYAQAFRLYVLYARGAAYAPLTRGDSAAE